MLRFNFNPFPELWTERLVLRKITLEDAPELFFLRSDERVLLYLGREPTTSILAVKDFIQQINASIESSISILWGIALQNKPGELIGTICYWNMQPENHRAEIGYLLHPDHWGKKLMKEAMTTVLDYGFNQIKLHSIEARLDANNQASAILLEKNGFVQEGYFKEDVFFKGKYQDTLVYCKQIHLNKTGDDHT